MRRPALFGRGRILYDSITKSFHLNAFFYNRMDISRILPLAVIAALLSGCRAADRTAQDSPRIVNIINFIRYTEPRDDEITEQVLYETVRSQAEDLRSKGLTGTYLLQYDALIDPSYQALMKEEMERGCEVGAWWEITQPHVEAAGYSWRGRYPWDWHANVEFSVGYTQAERERLVDVYMDRLHRTPSMPPTREWTMECGSHRARPKTCAGKAMALSSGFFRTGTSSL